MIVAFRQYRFQSSHFINDCICEQRHVKDAEWDVIKQESVMFSTPSGPSRSSQHSQREWISHASSRVSDAFDSYKTGTEQLSNLMSTMRRWCVRQVCDKRDVSQATWKTTLLLSSSAAGNSTSRCSRLQTPMLQVCGELASKQKQPGHHKHMPRSVNTSSLTSCPLYPSFIYLISSSLLFPSIYSLFFTVVFFLTCSPFNLFRSRSLVYTFLFLSSRPTSGSPIFTKHLDGSSFVLSTFPQSFCLH